MASGCCRHLLRLVSVAVGHAAPRLNRPQQTRRQRACERNECVGKRSQGRFNMAQLTCYRSLGSLGSCGSQSPCPAQSRQLWSGLKNSQMEQNSAPHSATNAA
eukprot:3932415-Rhodomonas_salina.2